MLHFLDLRAVTGDLRRVLPRPVAPELGPVEVVHDILADVERRGDACLRELTARFDGVELDRLRVESADCFAALDRIAAPLRVALEAAHAAITDYHQTQVHPPVDVMRDGLRLRSRSVPVDRAGCYVPGGRAPLASTVLMTASIANVAGVPDVVLCTPPDRRLGRPVDAILAAAAIAGVDEVYSVGGAQAIGAMAFGTDSIKAVDVIVGPGNVYVSLAKREVAAAGRVGVPSSFAGPSEVVVIADNTVPARSAAIDVVLQAEHGPDGLAWLISWDQAVLDAVVAEITTITQASPRRADIAANFAQGGYAVLVRDAAQAIELSNAVAPEHLELLVADPEALLANVRHAGAVFTGHWMPASVGDYIAGPSHVLPTFGSARFGSALTVSDFQKHLHVVSGDEAALRGVAPHIIALAEAEGLPAHADSVRFRVQL